MRRHTALEYRLRWRRQHYESAQSRVYQSRPAALRRARWLIERGRTAVGGRLLWVALEQRPVGAWQPSPLVDLEGDDLDIELREPGRRSRAGSSPKPRRQR